MEKPKTTHSSSSKKVYKKVYIVKDSSSDRSGYEESDSDFEQRSLVENDEFIPDADKVESDTNICQVVNPAQFEEETSWKYFKELKNI